MHLVSYFIPAPERPLIHCYKRQCPLSDAYTPSLEHHPRRLGYFCTLLQGTSSPHSVLATHEEEISLSQYHVPRSTGSEPISRLEEHASWLGLGVAGVKRRIRYLTGLTGGLVLPDRQPTTIRPPQLAAWFAAALAVSPGPHPFDFVIKRGVGFSTATSLGHHLALWPCLLLVLHLL